MRCNTLLRVPLTEGSAEADIACSWLGLYRFPMVSQAELSSLETAIRELSERITLAADELVGTKEEDVALDLYEVERSLKTAQRRIARAADGLAKS
tara:strand:+ start:882 stop:1169 length:288 start_codon:yes stop_codon:yes gene_type:complete